MSFTCFNLIAVMGPRSAVVGFRKDARRRLPSSDRKALGRPYEELSLQGLFHKHRVEAPSSDGVPGEGVCCEYDTQLLEMADWHGFARISYSLEVKNYEVPALWIPLSRCYRHLCFVDSQISLTDGSITSVYASRGRASTWDLPEARQNLHWERTARQYGVAKLDDAYEDDSVRSDAEHGMLVEALEHWDNRILRLLRRRGQL